MQARSWLLPIVLVVLLVLAAGAWLQRHSNPAPGEAATIPPPTTDATASPPGAAPSPPSAGPALAETVLGDLRPSLRDLVTRAERGDAQAACQVGVFLSSCHPWTALPWLATEGFQAELEAREAEREQKGDLESANQIASGQLAMREAAQHCAGIPSALMQRLDVYLRQAALAGHRPAMQRYLQAEHYFGAGATDASAWTTPAFDVWRREAPGLLRDQLEAGHIEAVVLLVLAHSHSGSQLSMVTPPDPLKDAAYRQLARLVFEDFSLPEGWKTDPITPAQAAEALALARDWHARHFGGRRWSVARDVPGFSYLHGESDGFMFMPPVPAERACPEAEAGP